MSRSARNNWSKKPRSKTLSAPALRIAFFGTPQVALPTLEALLGSRHPVVAVVTQPDRGRGRGRKESPSPVGERALAAGVPLLRPENVGDAETVETLSGCAADLGIVVAFGQFIPRQIRTLPRLGYLINGHASLLPRYRGASPIAQAILDGEEATGVSVMRVERAMDAGPVALVRRLEIGERETTGELTERLSALAAEALLETVEAIAENQVEWTEQDDTKASVAPKITRADGLIDWAQGATRCARQIHAMAPKPGAFTHLPPADGQAAELKILRAYALPAETADSPRPGELRLASEAADPPIRIGTAEGWLVPLEVQRAGGKTMDPAAFLRGHPLEDQLLLGSGEHKPGTP